MDTMDGFIVHCDRHWIDDEVMGPISFACHDEKYSKLFETICHRIGVSNDRFRISLSSELLTPKGSCTLSIMSDSDVSCLLSHNRSLSLWTEIKVEVVERSIPAKATENVFQTVIKSRNTTIQSCIPSGCKTSGHSESPISTPLFPSVSGSNQPFGPVPSLGFTSTEKDQGTPASTTKHADAEVKVDDYDSSSSESSSDESSSERQPSTDCREVQTNGAPKSSTPSTTTRWTIPGSELYSIQPIRSKELFQDNGDFSEIYKGQIFKDKKTLKGALGFNALQKRFDYRVRRSNHTRFVAICKKRDCQWVFRAGKSRNGTYWNVKSVDSKHTCGDNGNYNVDFHRVSSHVIGQLFARKFVDPGRNLRPKDIQADMKDKHGINLTYNKAYRSKDRALHSVFGDPWESFKTLPAYFHMLEKCNPGTKTKIATDRQNRFKYGFMALGACIEGFNTVIRPVIAVDATHLKSKTKGVLLVAVCKDGNEMIYPLAFGFANSECSKSWTWFLKQLHDVILHPELVLIVSDRHTGISNGMRAIFPNSAHVLCAYHFANNLKQHCRKRGDVIYHYYRAAYAYRVEKFDRVMAELKSIHPKVYDELVEVGIQKFSRVHSPRKRYHMMTTNIAESMNSCLLAIRKLPITSIAEFIRDLLQRWFHDRRSNARETPTFLTNDADQHIKDRVLASQRCEIHPIDYDRFKVQDQWSEAIVDLEQRSCSCREWDLDELPCIHAMAVATLKGKPINSLCSDFFTTGWLKQAYAMVVNPVPNPEEWDIADDVRNRVVLPWKKKRLTGRPKKNRMPSVGEKRKQQSCGNCGQKGHNQKSCTNPSCSTGKPAKKARGCSVCKKEGHNKLTCPDRDKAPDPSLAPPQLG
ncbi:hypothetical protein LWI29_007390 [Acer saccharum]|uniref:SWIM-type domain-containing protein n=1 Tax=Acer saccharum TaxID=4024 RepID=A0AA39RCG8_ACESA|nr:hypothetical protein LWI29_007390 [Acer saccharum]